MINIDILVFDRGNLLGTFTVPKPPEYKLITVYEQIPFKDKDYGPIDIMYFQDLNYGIAITDQMVGYCMVKL